MRRILFSIFCLLLSSFLLTGCTDKVEKSKKKYDEGVKLLQDGRKDDAEKKIKEAIELDPNNAKALFQLGFMHSEDPDEIEIAISYLRRGNKADPNNEFGHYTLAVMYGEKGRTDYEISELKKTIAINNDNDGAHYNLGVIYAQKRLYDNAEIEFNEVLRLNPKDSDALSNLGVVYIRSRKIKEADEVLTKLKGLDKEKAAKLSTLMKEIKAAEAKAKAAKEESKKEKVSEEETKEAKEDE